MSKCQSPQCLECGNGPCYHITGVCRACRTVTCLDCKKEFAPHLLRSLTRCVPCKTAFTSKIKSGRFESGPEHFLGKVATHEHLAAG